MAKTCSSCGKTIYSDTNICPYCKQSLDRGTNLNPSVDEPRKGLIILSFFIPPAAFVLFCVYLDSQPMAAKAYGIWGIVGAIVVPFIIFVLISVWMAATVWLLY